MRCALVVAVSVALALCAVVSQAGAQRAIGHTDATAAVIDPTSSCSIGDSYFNYDGSIENGYCWDGGGTSPPYYGAFGEAYDLGVGTINCGAFWLTRVYHYADVLLDCYVWAGGVTGEPGEVLCLVPGLVPTNVPYWPDCGQNDFQVGCEISGEFTLGWWADFDAGVCEWYTCVDTNGPGGYPWTCIQPGIGYPTGWHHPEEVWGSTASLAIGVVFLPREPSSVDEFPEHSPPIESPTWGRIKAIFGE